MAARRNLVDGGMANAIVRGAPELPSWCTHDHQPDFLDAPVRITSFGDLLGSGFLATVPSEQHRVWRWGYVVTAHRVIANQIGIEVQAPVPFGTGRLYEQRLVPTPGPPVGETQVRTRSSGPSRSSPNPGLAGGVQKPRGC